MTFPGIFSRLEVLGPSECARIINCCTPHLETSLVSKEGKKNEALRKSRSVLILPDDEKFSSIRLLMQRVVEAFVACSRTAFQYDMKAVEAIQFTEYKEGDYYNWHMDSSSTLPRTVSASLGLSSPMECQGGSLLFRDVYEDETEKDKVSIKLNQGEIAVFPSLLMHSVTPILKGTRYSLVLWSPTPGLDDKQIQQPNQQPLADQTQDPIVF